MITLIMETWSNENRSTQQTKFQQVMLCLPKTVRTTANLHQLKKTGGYEMIKGVVLRWSIH